MEPMIRSTGEFGKPASQMLRKFITEKQDDLWEIVSTIDYEEEQRGVSTRSVVVRPTQPATIPRPREAMSPISMEADEDISLEEPLMKTKGMESPSRSSTLRDLELSPTLSTVSSLSSISSSSSDSSSDSSSESDTETETDESEKDNKKEQSRNKHKETGKEKHKETERDECEKDNKKEQSKNKHKETGKEKRKETERDECEKDNKKE